MDKLPEHLRPPMSEVMDRINSSVPKKYSRLFILDPQNDCACPTEAYDTDVTGFIYFDANKKIVGSTGSRIHLPMVDLTPEDVELFMDEICERSEHNTEAVSTVVASSRDTFKPVFEYKDMLYRRYFNHKEWTVALPEQEFFGAVGANLRGVGMFARTVGFRAKTSEIRGAS